MLFSVIAVLNISHAKCPARCTCLAEKVECVRKGLKTIPYGIPLSTIELDLSQNQGLKLEKLAFINFTQLQTLTLKNCSLRNAFILPRNLASIDVGKNTFTIEALKELFTNAPVSLTTILVNGNKINFENGFSIFPNTTKSLNVGENTVKRFEKDDFNGLSNLNILVAGWLGLTYVEQGTFDVLKDLQKIDMQVNNLNKLPLSLFQNNHKLLQINLNRNYLTTMPDLRGIRSLNRLDLGWNNIKNVTGITVPLINTLYLRANQIEYFSFEKTTILELDLSHNKIKKLPKYSFKGHEFINELFLHSNDIDDVSPLAFGGLKWIRELHLQNNKIESLPKGIFKGLRIMQIFLYGNLLKNMTGVLDGMKTTPKQIILFDMLTSLNGKDFQGMSKDSTILIGCSKLRDITYTSKIAAKIKCSPYKGLYVTSFGRSLGQDGFDCSWDNSHVEYRCYPCSAGYHVVCDEYSSCRGHCIPCPAGSFYQDQMAQKSCKQCPFGQFVPPHRAPGKSPLDCLTCPTGTNTNSSAGYRACPCLDGYSRNDRFGACEKCQNSGFSCEHDYPILKRGYWMKWDQAQKTASNQSCEDAYKGFIDNLETTTDKYNRKTTKFSCIMPIPHKCPIRGSCLGGITAKCDHGYKGVLCAVCDNGYSRLFNKCIKCPKPFIAAVQFFGYFTLFVVVCLLVPWADKFTVEEQKQDRSLLQDSLILNEQRGSLRTTRTFADIILSRLKILLGFYQVLSSVIDAFSYIPWPQSLKKAVGVFEYLEFEVLRIPSLRCIKGSWGLTTVSEFWFALIATLLLPVFILVYFAIKAAIMFCISKGKAEFLAKCRESGKNCLRDIALFFFVTYPLTSRKIVQVLPISCHTFCITKYGGGCLRKMSYLRSDYSVECLDNSADHQTTLYTAYGALLLPIGLPIALFVALWWLHKKDRQSDEGDQRLRSVFEPTSIEYIGLNEEVSLRDHPNQNNGRFIIFTDNRLLYYRVSQ